MSDRREVSRCDVADDLLEGVDAMLPEACRMLSHDFLVRSFVDTERPHEPVVVDNDVAVLPDDLRQVVFHDLTRAPANGRHLRLAYVEAAYDHVARHRPDHRRPEDDLEHADLRAVQAPLKERYRAEPDAARVTLTAEGTVGDGQLACRVETGRALVEAGLHPATGGSGQLACSGDMLLQALVACAGVTLAAVAEALEVEVAGTVRAEGDLDFRGTLGLGKEDGVPVGFTSIRLRFDLEKPTDEESLQRLVRLTERYCVVYQTLASGVPVATSA
jgi:uncharacterized OsmC-like protein